MLKIGCHLSISDGFYNAAKIIKELGGNTFQYFSRNPRGGSSKAWDQKDFEEFKKFSLENNIGQLLTHAPYTLNPCSETISTREFALQCFTEDLEVLEKFGNGLYNFHPGSHVGQGVEVGTKLIIDTLNKVLNKEQTSLVLLETMSGKGSEIGRFFEELKAIIDGVFLKDKIGVCLDTCHVYSAGYDIVNDLDNVLIHFDNVIGLDKLKAIHLNDSMMEYNSNKDRHAKIGEGYLGLETIIKIINHPKLKNIPFFLETPNENEGYAKEIELLKSKYKD